MQEFGYRGEAAEVRQRLLLLVIAALLPLVVVIGVLAFLSVSQKRAFMREAAIGYSADMLASVDRELRAHSNLVEILSRSPSLDGPSPNLEQFHRLASRFVDQVQGWDRVILADAAQGQVANTAIPFGSKLPEIVDPEGFDHALAHEGASVTNLTGPGPNSSHGQPSVALRKRIDLTGSGPYVLSVLLRADVFERAITEARIEPVWRAFLIDGTDRVIAAPRATNATGLRASEPVVNARAAGTSGVYNARAWTGEPVITAFIKSPETGWSAHISIPAAEYNEPLRRSIMIIGGPIFIGLALFGLFAFLARRELISMKADADALSRASRMEALGRITGGVAHDFNNLLMVITTGADLVRKRMTDEGAERFLTAIQSAAERGSRLTRQLMMFARGQSGAIAIIEVGLRLASIKSLLQQSATESIPIEYRLPKERHFIKVDPDQFDLAVINIVANARDATPNGGKIVIALERAAYPDRSGRSGLRLSISDTGTGIQSEILPYVFEPFFTTKAIGGGAGLGLSHVYGFAQAHGGLADIASETGKGATVTIYLPEVDEPAVAEPADLWQADETSQLDEASQADENWRADGLEAIIVDDNDDVRILTGEVLADLGFKVRYASNASEALALCEAGADLVVSDIVMPGSMDGVALARIIRQRWPDMQAILMTGYSDASTDAVAARMRVIRKPFTRATLLRAISTGRFEGVRRRRNTKA